MKVKSIALKAQRENVELFHEVKPVGCRRPARPGILMSVPGSANDANP